MIEVLPASLPDKTLLQRLMELYQYDFSEFDGADLDAHASYGYAYLDHYWVEEGRHPFLVRVDGKLAGFVLVSDHALLPGNERSITEFFIMRKYRRRGIGKHVSYWIFDFFPGKWEIQEIAPNLPAQRFWRSVITAYTNGQYSEVELHDDRWDGVVQSFDNSGAP
jgi:predicted acetyltransferase